MLMKMIARILQGSRGECWRCYSAVRDPPQELRQPRGLDGKNWRDFRQKKRLGNDKWQPTKRLTWHQIEHLKTLRQTDPEEWTKSKLSRWFGISVPAVNRILRSKFVPSEEIRERQDVRARERVRERRGKQRSEGILYSDVEGYCNEEG